MTIKVDELGFIADIIANALWLNDIKVKVDDRGLNFVYEGKEFGVEEVMEGVLQTLKFERHE